MENNSRSVDGDLDSLVIKMDDECEFNGDRDVEKDGYGDLDNDGVVDDADETGPGPTPISTISTRREINQHDHDCIPVEKIENYTDMVFALCLTALIFPLATSTNHYEVAEDLRDILAQEFANIVVYAGSYIMLLSVWQQHCWVFAGFEQIGDTISILNVVFLLCVSSLPYFASFMASHRSTPLSVQLFAFSLMLIGLTMAVIVAFAYRKKKMLIREFRQRRYKPSLVEYLLAFGIHSLFSALAVAVSRQSVLASYIFLLFVIFAGSSSALCMALYKYLFVGSKQHRKLWKQFWARLSARPLPKTRIIALMDGVFAVVGMLIMLNLIGEMAPHHKLDASRSSRPLDSRLKVILFQEREVLLAHGAAFVSTGMMWYIHTMISNQVETISRYMRIALQLMMISLGLTPYSFRLLIRYSKSAREEKSLRENEDTTIMFHCGLLICASGMQLIYWISAHWKRHRHRVHQILGVHHVKSLTLLLVFPILNLTLFLMVLKPGTVTSMTVWRVQSGSVLIFLAVKMVFEIYTYVSRRSPPPKYESQTSRDEDLVKLESKTCTCDRAAIKKAKKSIKDVTRTSGIAVIFQDNHDNGEA
ncbi:endosomal/lysosomal potassium channel TMEM175-like [Lytechinus variegatus]|uniref:endosomal/lysosomal potassium channel TMEM175-like n=1 Tax=Lytechinus variegatus TaxID=7654 RepID=UPI001BB189E4|nr:endosomal/lysosomal potassium channel TMEM175-like [Lytechinus variegatus]